MQTVAAGNDATFIDGSTRGKATDKLRLPLLSQYLREQQDLTAVERFSQHHEDAEAPLQQKFYRELIPLTTPGPGQQYGFEVDLDRCSGCKACVTACHSLNGLDEGETWRSVGLLHGGTTSKPMQKTVTTACHHCVDPACMKGCPVGAYTKDSITGIVRHLDDQCIGCQYCIWTCPYEVPQFSPKRGIVRKCDMCSDRLAASEAPACVQACPNEAIAIRIVNVADVVEQAQVDTFLPAAPSPELTLPTTNYKTKNAMARNMLPADFYQVRSTHQHMPLVVMLVLTQLSVGAFILALILPSLLAPSTWALLAPFHALVALVFGTLPLAAATSHLGRPQYAFRAFLGFRTSWFSREVIALGAFSAAATVYAGALFLGSRSDLWPGVARVAVAVSPPIGWMVALLGAVGVGCSAMLYHATRRRWWNISKSGFKFYMTAAVLGVATSITTTFAALFNRSNELTPDVIQYGETMAIVLVTVTLVKLAGEATIFFHLSDRREHDLKRSARLLSGELARTTVFRFSLGLVGGVILPLVSLTSLEPSSSIGAVMASTVCLAALVAGELLERMNFFAAMSSPRMPGTLR